LCSACETPFFSARSPCVNNFLVYSTFCNAHLACVNIFSAHSSCVKKLNCEYQTQSSKWRIFFQFLRRLPRYDLLMSKTGGRRRQEQFWICNAGEFSIAKKINRKIGTVWKSLTKCSKICIKSFLVWKLSGTDISRCGGGWGEACIFHLPSSLFLSIFLICRFTKTFRKNKKKMLWSYLKNAFHHFFENIRKEDWPLIISSVYSTFIGWCCTLTVYVHGISYILLWGKSNNNVYCTPHSNLVFFPFHVFVRRRRFVGRR